MSGSKDGDDSKPTTKVFCAEEFCVIVRPSGGLRVMEWKQREKAAVVEEVGVVCVD